MKEIQPQQIWNEEKMEGVKKLIQKQKLIDMMEQDEQLGLYEETKCYCGHTTTCDCGPEEPKYTTSNLDNEKYKDFSVSQEEPKQEDMITKIMQMDAKMAYDSLPKQSTKDRILSETSKETKQRVRDTANKLVMKQETLEEAALKQAQLSYYGDEVDAYVRGSVFGAKWEQERSYETRNT